MITAKVTTDWQLESLMIAAIAVRTPDFDDEGLPFIPADSLPDIDRALVEASREIAKLRAILARCVERITEDNDEFAADNAALDGKGYDAWQEFMPDVWHEARRVLGDDVT